MIPANIDYHRPGSIDAALALLTEHGEAARVVAGGHSLIPMMKLRMAEVPHLVDLRAIDALRGISVTQDRIRQGALVTQAEIVADAGLAGAAPILRETALQIADPQVRNMGTIGGNVANGDPGNDMPAVMQALDARFTLQGPSGTREIAAREFYEAAYTTAREEDEILTAITFAPPRGGQAYEKQKRKIGDYATAAAAVILTREGDRCTAAAIAMTNLSDTPVFSQTACEALIGTGCDRDAVTAAVAAMRFDIDPGSDNRGPAEFKRHVAGAVLRRAIARAWEAAA